MGKPICQELIHQSMAFTDALGHVCRNERSSRTEDFLCILYAVPWSESLLWLTLGSPPPAAGPEESLLPALAAAQVWSLFLGSRIKINSASKDFLPFEMVLLIATQNVLLFFNVQRDPKEFLIAL